CLVIANQPRSRPPAMEPWCGRLGYLRRRRQPEPTAGASRARPDHRIGGCGLAATSKKLTSGLPTRSIFAVGHADSFFVPLSGHLTREAARPLRRYGGRACGGALLSISAGAEASSGRSTLGPKGFSI